MARRRYTDEFRASACLMLEAAGYPDKKGALTQVSKHLKVPHNTVRAWFHAEANPPPSELRQEKKEDLVALLTEHIYKALDAADNVRIDAHYKDLVTGAAIMIDKKQLLEGKPTERSEVNVKDDRERIMARLAGKAGGYVAPAKNAVGSRPN